MNAKNDPDEKALYSVAENTVGVRLQKAVDPDVDALLLDSDDFSTSDLEEDFVLQANIHEEGDDIHAEGVDDVIDKNLTKEDDEHNAQESEDDEFGAEDDNIAGEKARVRRLLDEQFDEVTFLCSL